MHCNNCGEKGHVFKECPNPITSCGIILLNVKCLPTDHTQVKVLMVQRKHSMAFTEFVRGKYDIENIEYIKKKSVESTKYENMDKIFELNYSLCF